MTSGKKEFSLLELNACVRNTLQESLPERYWVRAEISEARIHPSGHCYLELIEKEEQSGKTVAKARATIWATTFRLLQPWFEQSTGQLFTSGIKSGLISELIRWIIWRIICVLHKRSFRIACRRPILDNCTGMRRIACIMCRIQRKI